MIIGWRGMLLMTKTYYYIHPSQDKNTFCCGEFFLYSESNYFQLRAHIYQARDLPCEDASGESDPYMKIYFGHQSGKTLIIKNNSCPTFDQV